MSDRLPPVAWVLGIAGLIPQVLALLAAWNGYSYVSVAFGFVYAALIFSFLGGLWWGVAVARPDAPQWLYAVAVLPSLIAFASYFPRMLFHTGQAPSLVVLGLGLIASLVIDRTLARGGYMSADMLRLRVILSLGLGLLTLALALRA